MLFSNGLTVRNLLFAGYLNGDIFLQNLPSVVAAQVLGMSFWYKFRLEVVAGLDLSDENSGFFFVISFHG